MVAGRHLVPGGLRRQADARARRSRRAGRDPDAIVPAIMLTCFIGDDDELAEILEAPLVKAFALQIPAT